MIGTIKLGGLGWLKEQIGIYPTSIFESESLKFLTQMIHVIFTAVTASRTGLQRFDLNVGLANIPPEPNMLQLPESFVNSEAFPSTLHTLGLLLDAPSETDATTWAMDPGRFIMHFDHLEDLVLAFDTSLEAQYLKELHDNIHLEKLCALEISAVEGGEEELALILLSHRATVQKVILDAINLPSLESWRLLLERMRDQLSLTYLELSNCSVDDIYAVIIRGQTPLGDNGNYTIIFHGEETTSYLTRTSSRR
jgi:hypothetical protein